MSIKMSEYRKLVAKSINTKSSKLGLSRLTKNSRLTLLTSGMFNLVRSVNELVEQTNPLVIGYQYNEQMKQDLKPTMAYVAQDIVFMARLLKVKLPTPTKKVKLEGGRVEILSSLTLPVARMFGVFRGLALSPPTKMVEKEIVLPSEGGKKVMRTVPVLDKEAYASNVADTETGMGNYLAAVIHAFWGLSFDLFGAPPAELFDLSESFMNPVPILPVKATKTKKSKAA